MTVSDPLELQRTMSAEHERLSAEAQRSANWKRWEPYLSERQGATVREDYSPEKHSPHDILIRVTVANRGPEAATLHLLPTLWFRNNWSWRAAHEGSAVKPQICLRDEQRFLLARHESLGDFRLAIGPDPGGRQPPVLLTENESNLRRLWNYGPEAVFVKDAFHEYVIHGRKPSVIAQTVGTKAAPHYILTIPAGGSQHVKLRLFAEKETRQKNHSGRLSTRSFRRVLTTVMSSMPRLA